MVSTPRILPPLTDATRRFWTGGRDGELLIEWCTSCGRWQHPPMGTCRTCGGPVEHRPVSGRGTVFTFTVNHHQFHPEVPPPYVIAVVELAEQPDLRVPANLVDCDPADVRIGLPVEVRFEAHGEVHVPVFAPATGVPAATSEPATTAPADGPSGRGPGPGRQREPAPETGSVIAGIGISDIGRRLGVAGLDLTTAACTEAIADAGLQPSDIDGVATMGDTPIDEVAAALGLELRYTGGGFDTGGLLSPVMSACLAVAQGRARHVLVYRTVAMMGGTIVPPKDGAPPARAASTGDGNDRAAMASVMGDMAPLLAAHAYSAANWLAMHCHRHMHRYGTTKEQLGWLALNSRANAARNPRAAYRDPMTMDDYLGARPVSSPFGLLDCDVPVDGSIALVVSSADHAAACDHPVRIAAMGGASGAGGWVDRPDYPKMAATDAAAQLWSRTDLTPADVDLAELYDGFTFLTFAWLEALGLCGEGEAGPFVEGGSRIALDGPLPLNTYGGQLSAGRMHGYWVLHEACLQLRGQAGDRQVADPEVAVVSAGGGPIAGCMLLTR